MGVCCTREENKNKCFDVPPSTSTEPSPVNSDKERIMVTDNDNSVVIKSFNPNTELHYNVKYKPRKVA
jgi:hypothetical protein